MSQTSRERRNFPIPVRWPHAAGNDPSRPGHCARRTVRSLIRSERLPRCLLYASNLASADPPAASCRRQIHPRTQRRDQIPIAPAAPPVPNFARLRDLALFGRRPPQRVERVVMPASKNLHKPGSDNCQPVSGVFQLPKAF
jgi:hypothetical protein